MTVTKMGDDHCPTCNTITNRSTAMKGGGAPIPGDLSICIKCGEYCFFESDMALAVLPSILFDELPKDLRLQL